MLDDTVVHIGRNWWSDPDALSGLDGMRTPEGDRSDRAEAASGEPVWQRHVGGKSNEPLPAETLTGPQGFIDRVGMVADVRRIFCKG